MREQNKYTRLLSNTVLFGLSTFSSKVLSFVLTRLYTSVLSQASFGVVDLVTACANLLIPLVSLGISNAVIRFGLEKEVKKSSVLTGGIVAIGTGFTLLLLFMPLISRLPIVSGYAFLMCVFVLISCIRTLCCQFVRARLRTKLYAIDGILSTGYTIGFNVLFLVVFKLGPIGYLLSIICADALSSIGLILIERMWQYVHFREFDWTLYKNMLRYCLPLVPALMFWWVTNASDRIFVSYICGEAQNGLYAAAYKVPTIVTIFSTIFTEAWQLSAVTDGQGRGRSQFFTQVFNALSAATFTIGGVLIYACRLIMRFLVSPNFFSAWLYIPFLVLATVFSCLVSFLNSVYMVEKKSSLSLLTMLLGAVANLILNALFIPQWGPAGAALATFFSYALVFIVRAISIRRFIHIRFEPTRLMLNTLFICAQALVMMADPPLWPLWCGLLFVGIAVLNGTWLAKGLLQVLRKHLKPKKPV